MIIGITGTLGAGKGTIVEYLIQKGFRHYSVREFLIKEINKRSLPVNRDSMVLVANQLREINSPSYIIERLLEKANQEGENSIIESIRTQGEAEKIKEGGILLAIDADSQIRYSRISKRQSETDRISFDRFIEDERREMFSTDPTKQNLSACIKMADFVLNNDGTLDNLYRQIEEVYKKIILEKGQEKKLGGHKRPSWDEYFIKITALVAERSTCLRHNVGAIIVKNKRVITTGYNGAVKGAKDCLELGCKKDELKLETGFGAEQCRAVHAEQNAIAQAGLHGVSIDGGTMYCTHIPCRMCAKQIINAGLKELIYYFDYAGSKGSLDLLKESGIKVKKIERPNPIINFKD
ncbi:MAG: deaminase [Nanoarchaeota archaeon]|nr:AAA family ATPase [Nanoarchaeota archaeon]